MDLAPGTRIGVYEIVAKVGEGGMGQVYRATDTTLGRHVAIKILPAAFAADPDRLARFEREAKTLASLNHPHIAALYGFEKSGGLHALAMEFVEGEDLSLRIDRGPIPLDEALPMAKQIAQALEAAHAQGIIHRDLKPANIKLRPDGTVKVLDFGLAKALDSTGASAADLSISPTYTSPALMTHSGVILGTAAYMSPEQARGRPVGVQADIWAFGCVLYEMLAGRSPFKGPTVTDVLAAIVRAEPDWTALPAETPATLRSLLRRCLQKDVSRRLHHIGDARLELEEIAPDGPTPSARARANRTPWLIALLLGGVAAALAVALALKWRSGSDPRELRVDVATPDSSDSLSIALSPDGLKLAYVASVTGGAARLHVRSLVDGSVKSYERTDFASNPFWSPDGQSLGFFADGKLMRIDLTTGLTQALTSAPIGGGGSWNRDDIVLYSPTIIGGLYKVSASGGTPVAATNRSKQEVGHRSPRFLPDGQHFIYYVSGDTSVRGTYLAALDGSVPPKRLIDAADVTLIASDFLVFQRQGTLFAQRLLAERGELSGAPVAIAGGVAFDIGTEGGAVVAASPNRSIAYRSGGGGGQRELVWFDRAGRKLDTLGAPDPALINPEFSPDGRFVAVNRLAEAADVWLVDMRGTRRRFTFDPGTDQIPVWPDDHRIIFSSNRTGTYDLYEKPADRPGAEQLLFASSENKFPMGVSSDGRYLLYRNTGPNTNWDLWALPLSGEKKPFLAVNSPFQEMIGEFSPDGRWIAYQTNESGQFEVFVQSFPEATTRTMISSNGGSQPRWRRDGKELFFVTLDGRLMAAPLALNANHMLESGPPVALFSTHMPGGAVPSPQKQQYAVSADGQRFLFNTIVGDTSSASVSLILNWHPPDGK